MKEKILVVEDNPQNVRLIEMVLRASNYRLIIATNGEEAVETAVREKPDLILMDIQLPGISGTEATRQLRKLPEFADIPIIGLTAYAMKGDKEKILEAGCNSYISKPFNTRELPGIIDDMLIDNYKDNP